MKRGLIISISVILSFVIVLIFLNYTLDQKTKKKAEDKSIHTSNKEKKEISQVKTISEEEKNLIRARNAKGLFWMLYMCFHNIQNSINLLDHNSKTVLNTINSPDLYDKSLSAKEIYDLYFEYKGNILPFIKNYAEIQENSCAKELFKSNFIPATYFYEQFNIVESNLEEVKKYDDKNLGDCKSFDTELVWCHGHKIISTPCKD
jgi:hypothetical protein